MSENTMPHNDADAARQARLISLGLYERSVEASANAMMITSAEAPEYAIEYVNPAFERITGYSAGEVIGRNCRFLQGDDQDQPGLQEIRRALAEQRATNVVLRNYRKDGTLFWNHLYVAPVEDTDGAVTHFVASQYDITEIKSYEMTLRHLATHDELTGLANRSLLNDHLRGAMARAERSGSQIWVVFLDLDRFKVFNDSLGHMAGDVFLMTIAQRLQASLRATDLVARLSSDEFALVLCEQPGHRLNFLLLERIANAVQQALQFDRKDFFLTCSMGVAIYPADGVDAEQLIERADMAMFQAKERGRNNYQFYTDAINQRALERMQIGSALRAAIEREEFVLHYQPQLDLDSGRVIGTEALIRWRHPEMGLVYPDRFIGIAEETGLIVAIGDWVLRTACQETKRLQGLGHPDLRVAVNLSARQFARSDLAHGIEAALQDSGLEPCCLEIEITESLMMHDVDGAIGSLRALKDLGVRLSIDDFGTGYSSLAYLKRFPIDNLKIDRSFVSDIVSGHEEAAIVSSIISLAHNLRLQVTAEGVETEEQLAYLRNRRCNKMQGYLFSKPVPAEMLPALLGACLPAPATAL
ncbi:putative bifunctional diguanylate cyclase/phosphodiesterase [Noviherbaspirillum pedocola]|nr:EAL domain-containing protein [Noviherbaspirillum pedocola]